MQPLAALALLGRLRVLLLGLQLDAETVGQRLERAREVEPLGLHHEREHVAGGLAAEAVVDLLDRVDAERGRALVVERAAAEVLVAPARRSSVRSETTREHVDRVAHAIARVGRV